MSYVQKDADTEKGWDFIAHHAVFVSGLMRIQILS